MKRSLQAVTAALNTIYEEPEARSMAVYLFRHLTGWSSSRVMSSSEAEFSAADDKRLAGFIDRLLKHEPLQYVLGSTEFYGLTFATDKRVLIPRPETEELVEWIISDYGEREGLQVLDLCTGSGCIAIALARHLKLAKVSACDVSGDALALASGNAAVNGAGVDFFRADVLRPDCLEAVPSPDIMVSNPPYVTESEKNAMSRNVLDYEPHLALFVPDTDPLMFYRAIAVLAAAKLSSGGALYVEINRALGDETVELFKNSGFARVELRRDLSGNPRMVKAVKR
jgi:release factor glutamine methyltransferase